MGGVGRGSFAERYSDSLLDLDRDLVFPRSFVYLRCVVPPLHRTVSFSCACPFPSFSSEIFPSLLIYTSFQSQRVLRTAAAVHVPLPPFALAQLKSRWSRVESSWQIHVWSSRLAFGWGQGCELDSTGRCSTVDGSALCDEESWDDTEGATRTRMRSLTVQNS